jgi:hypothetical protein
VLLPDCGLVSWGVAVPDPLASDPPDVADPDKEELFPSEEALVPPSSEWASAATSENVCAEVPGPSSCNARCTPRAPLAAMPATATPAVMADTRVVAASRAPAARVTSWCGLWVIAGLLAARPAHPTIGCPGVLQRVCALSLKGLSEELLSSLSVRGRTGVLA